MAKFLEPQWLHGTIKNHRKSAPYPFQSKTDFWQSKVKIEVHDYEEDGEEEVYMYKGYVIPGMTKAFRGDQEIDPATLKKGQRIKFEYQTKAGTPLRGRLLTVKVY